MIKKLTTLLLIASLCTFGISELDARQGSFRSNGYTSGKTFTPKVRPTPVPKVPKTTFTPRIKPTESIYKGPSPTVSGNSSKRSHSTHRRSSSSSYDSGGSILIDTIFPAATGYALGKLSEQNSQPKIVEPKITTYLDLCGVKKDYAEKFLASNLKATEEDRQAYISLNVEATDSNKVYSEKENTFVNKLKIQIEQERIQAEKERKEFNAKFLKVFGSIFGVALLIGLVAFGINFFRKD